MKQRESGRDGLSDGEIKRHGLLCNSIMSVGIFLMIGLQLKWKTHNVSSFLREKAAVLKSASSAALMLVIKSHGTVNLTSTSQHLK